MLVCRGTPSYYGVGVFSLPIPHGMYLVAPTQLCPFGWCVIPARHLLQKSPGRNLKIGFPLFSPPNHTLLPLTHDLTVSYIGWVLVGEVWALRVPSFHMCPKSTCCSLVRCGLEACLHSPPSIFYLLCKLFFRFPASLRGWAFFVTGLYISFGPFLDCLHFLPYHSIIFAVMIQSCWASLGLPFILSSNGLIWPLVFLLMGSYGPFLFLLGILGSFAFLGFLSPFTNSTFQWVFTNFIGLPWPNYLILILGVHELVINLLLFLFALLWACSGLFSLFYIIYCP